MNSQILSQALTLIASPHTWCKGARARNKEGAEVPVMSRTAVQFCSKGALLRAVGDEKADISQLERFLTLKGNKGNPLGLHYVGFNELKTHGEVLLVWSEAIRMAVEEEALGGQLSPKEVVAEFLGTVK